MTKLEVLQLIADNLKVSWKSYGTWEIKSTVCLPRTDDEDDTVITLREITHNEDNYTGIFDGSLFNPLCGFPTYSMLKTAAAEENMTVEDLQDRVWQDSANHDNYEPAEVRNCRLAENLYEILEEQDFFEVLDITD